MSAINTRKLKGLYSRTLIMSRPKLDTVVLQDQKKPSTESESNTAPLGEEELEVNLILRGIFESFHLRRGTAMKLGRFEPDRRQPDELDLSPYGASERGVSRFHAQLSFKNNQVFITDLQSTNGTYVRGVKVVPYVPTRVCKGDEVRLGRFPFQIMFD
jgi:pSer/pThr/pTyr-binding forkhead associated (FHA) protein